MYALYIIIGAIVIVVFIIIAICYFGKCCRCRQQELPPDEPVNSDPSQKNAHDVHNQNSERNGDVSVQDPSMKSLQASARGGNISPFPKSPPLTILKPPPQEIQKEFKKSHRSIREKHNNDDTAIRRQIPFYDFTRQPEFKKSHRSIRQKSPKNDVNDSSYASRKDEDDSPSKSQSSKKTTKRTNRSSSNDKMEKTQKTENSEKTEKTRKSEMTEKTDETEKTKKSSRKN